MKKETLKSIASVVGFSILGGAASCVGLYLGTECVSMMETLKAKIKQKKQTKSTKTGTIKFRKVES